MFHITLSQLIFLTLFPASTLAYYMHTADYLLFLSIHFTLPCFSHAVEEWGENGLHKPEQRTKQT